MPHLHKSFKKFSGMQKYGCIENMLSPGHIETKFYNAIHIHVWYVSEIYIVWNVIMHAQFSEFPE